MKVEVVDTTLVTPSEPTPRHTLWLSNLDLAVPKTHTPLVYYYPAPPAGDGDGEKEEGEGFFAPERLREALARALVPFYPLAGRMATGPEGRLEIDCNGEGALFVVARADFTGDEMFRDFEPSPEARRLLVPFAASGDPPCLLAMVQVTFLKCGGVAVGTGMHHVTMDGAGAIQFIRTWTTLARGLDAAYVYPSPPVHDRTVLRARSPPHVTFEHPVYSPSNLNGLPRPFVTRVYAVSPKLLAGIKSSCAPGVSTYCALTAHLWRAMCVARGLAPDAESRLRVPANIRQRLRPQLPANYFGNAIVRDLVMVRVGDVMSQPLGFVAERIKRAVARVDDAFVCSVIDYLELESISPPFVSSTWPWLPASSVAGHGASPAGASSQRADLAPHADGLRRPGGGLLPSGPLWVSECAYGPRTNRVTIFGRGASRGCQEVFCICISRRAPLGLAIVP